MATARFHPHGCRSVPREPGRRLRVGVASRQYPATAATISPSRLFRTAQPGPRVPSLFPLLRGPIRLDAIGRRSDAAPGDGSNRSGAQRRSGEQHPEQVFRSLSRHSDLRPYQVERWVEAALALLSSGVNEQVDAVAEGLGNRESGVRLYVEGLLAQATAGAGSEAAAARQLQEHLQQLLGVLQVICHGTLCDHLTARPWRTSLLLAVRGSTNLTNLAEGLELLLRDSPTQPPGCGRQENSTTITWLEVAWLLTSLVLELLKRFQGPEDRAALRTPCERLLVASERMAAATAGSFGSSGAPHPQSSKVKRVQTAIRNARSMLNIGDSMGTRGVPPGALSQASTTADQAATSPESLPGHLRPAGPRHNNDSEDFTQINVVPTLEELLCDERPYLPANRADHVPEHLRERTPSWARLDTLFRLLRQDATAPMAEALRSFVRAGGIRAAQKGDAKGKQSATQQRDLFLYRDVQLQGLYDDFIQVTIQPPPQLGKRMEVQEWWVASKRLAVGTLIALAWEGQQQQQQQHLAAAVQAAAGASAGPVSGAAGELAQQVPQQQQQQQQQLQLVIGEVVQRQEDVSKDSRPCVGIRISSGQDALLEALVTGVTAGVEVVLVQDKNSFFAYRPILAALQAMAGLPLPLAEHLLPACRTTAEQPRPGVPAYLQDGAVYDLSSLAEAREQLLGDVAASEVDRTRQRLAAVAVAQPNQFPVSELVAATSLDQAQVEALKAVLTQEVAVVQGPPGTGKTFVSIQATRLLLSNTVGDTDRDTASMGLRASDRARGRSGNGLAARPTIGPLVVVTYTNHALDQYLEGLLDVGVDSILRLGHGSKSARLEPYFLSKWTGRPGRLPPVQGLRQRLDQLNEELMALLAECRAEAARTAPGARDQQTARPPRRPPASVVALTFPQLVAAAALSSELQPLLSSLRAGQRPINKAGLVDIVCDWLRGSPREDAQRGRLGTSGRAAPEGGTDSDEGEEEEGEKGEVAAGNDGFGGMRTARATGGDEAGGEGDAKGGGRQLGDGEVQEAEMGVAALDDPLVTRAAREAGLRAAEDMTRLLIDGWSADDREQQQARSPTAAATQQQQQQSVIFRSVRAVGLSGTQGGPTAEASNQAGAEDVSHVPSAAEVAAMMAQNRPLEELLLAQSVWEMSRVERRRLYCELRQRSLAALASKVQAKQQELRAALEGQQVEYDKCKLDALRSARVVGLTTSQLANSQRLIQALRPKVVIVEEAAEVFEAHVLTCLVGSVEHLVLIGDHEQLRPKANTYEMQAYSGKGYNLDVSLFERLVTGGWPVSVLQQQRRMRPQISNLIRKEIYPALTDHPSVQAYPPVRGLVQNVFLWDHTHPDKGSADESSRSRSNPWEAAAAVALARYLLQQGYRTEDIVILVPYVGQLMAVRQELRNRNFRVIISDADSDQIAKQGVLEGEEGEVDVAKAVFESHREARGESIRVATVDNFQGEEARVIIISATCSNNEAYIGFLKMRNRVNVMLSRAQHGMYILANTTTLLSSANTRKTPLWAAVRDQLEAADCLGQTLPLRCEKHGTVTHVREVSDFEALVGDGGCNQPCGALLPCGHTCPRRCHTDDPSHERTRCTAPCDRLHTPCGHPCDKLCHEDCGPCGRVISAHPLLCGHVATNVPCATVTSGQFECKAPREVEVPGCGHVLTVPCHTAPRYLISPQLCPQPVAVEMALCGHSCTVPCGERTEATLQPERCREQCGCTLSCYHQCKGRCGGCAGGRLTKGFGPLAAAVGFRPLTVDDAGSEDEEQGDTWRASTATRLLGRRRVAQEAAPEPELRRAAGLVSYAASHGGLQQLKDALERQVEGHAACREPCDRNLACGHYCANTCHRGQSCPTCSKPCWIACDHVTCKRKCGEPCIPCADSCSWSCEHQGACGAPCGAPCDRLPCDERCSKVLSCGHRCPGLCGEPCPPSDYCVHPDCRTKAPERIRQQVVDFLEWRTFSEVTADDVAADPLVVLPGCGHVYTASSLDGHLELAGRFYVRGSPKEGSTAGPWLGLRPLPDDQDVVKGCPDCRAPIQGVRRYGRAARKAALDLIDRKHQAHGATLLAEAAQRLRSAEAELQAWPTAAATSTPRNRKDKKEKAAVVTPSQALQDIVKRLEAAAAAYNKLATNLQRGPKRHVYEAAVSRVKKGIERAAEDRAMEVQLAQLPSEAAGAEGGGMRGGASASSSGKQQQELYGGAAARAARNGDDGAVAGRLEAAENALYTLRDDWQAVWAARCGYLAAMEQVLRAAAKGMDAHRSMFDGRGGYQQERDRNKRRAQVAWLMTHAARRAAEVLATAAPEPEPSTDGRRPPEAWVQLAARRGDTNSSLQLAAAVMSFRLAMVSHKQACKAHLALQAGEGAREPLDVLRRSQMSLLDQVLDQVREAELIFSASPLAAMGSLSSEELQRDAPAGASNGAGDDGNSSSNTSNSSNNSNGILGATGASAAMHFIRQLGDRAQAAKQQVEKDSFFGALEVVARHEFGTTLNSMSGHLYRCKKGHIYMVGECGSPRQTARCSECGEPIGMGSGDAYVEAADLR